MIKRSSEHAEKNNGRNRESCLCKRSRRVGVELTEQLTELPVGSGTGNPTSGSTGTGLLTAIIVAAGGSVETATHLSTGYVPEGCATHSPTSREIGWQIGDRRLPILLIIVH